jgi:hypothetical protein
VCFLRRLPLQAETPADKRLTGLVDLTHGVTP